MTHSTVRRRSRVTRAAGVIAATALAGTGVVATSTTAFAEETAPTIETRDASAFAEQAAELPGGLIDAVSRDLGLTGEEYLANAATARSAANAVNALKADGVNVNTAVVDGQDVTIYVAGDGDVEAAEATGANVTVGEPETSGNLEKQEVQLLDDLRNGYGYANFPEDGGQGGRCSIGFNGTGGNFLTAGHCANTIPAGSPAFYLDIDGPLFDGPVSQDDLVPMGTTGEHNLGGGQDGGLVNVDASAGPGWQQQPEVSTWGGGTGGPTEGDTVSVYDSTDPVVGAPVCKSGATSGWTCGDILFAEDTIDIGGDMITAFVMNTCVLSGDSGGTILSGNYAVGVNSWGSVTENTGCSDAEWPKATEYQEGGLADGNVSGGYQVASGSQNAENDFGGDWDLMISVGTPTITNPADGGEVGQTFTIQGEVAAAEGASVTVNIDGAGEYEGTVDSNGSFSAPVDDALEPGDYSWTAVASHTAETASDATVSGEASGSFTVVENAAAAPVVDSPEAGQTTSSARPSFTGSGEPGAEVTLTVGEDAYGSATVNDDGSWTIDPESDLPKAQRFDAVVTQSSDAGEQSVTVADLGIRVADATITSPEDGSDVGPDVVFEGTAEPGSEIGITIGPADADADAASMSVTFADGEVETADEEIWHGEWTFEGNAWTFTPDEPLQVADYTVSIETQLGDDTDLGASSASSTFSVVEGGGDAGGGEGDDSGLPDTGSSTMPLIIGAIVLVLAGGAALIVVRARRNSSSNGIA